MWHLSHGEKILSNSSIHGTDLKRQSPNEDFAAPLVPTNIPQIERQQHEGQLFTRFSIKLALARYTDIPIDLRMRLTRGAFARAFAEFFRTLSEGRVCTIMRLRIGF